MTEKRSEWVVMAEGVRRRILTDGDKLMVVEVRAEPGSTVKLHSHPNEQVSFLAEGRAVFTVGDRKIEMKQGDAVPIPSNVPHAVLFVDKCIFIDSFSPPREDFRAGSR